MTTGIVLTFITHLLVPLLLVWGLWRGEFKSKISWLASTLGSGSYILYFFLVGAGWAWVSYYFRAAIPILFLVAAFLSFRRIFGEGVPWWRNPGSVGGWAGLATNVFLAALFTLTTVLAAQGFFYGETRAVRLASPLPAGVWYVGHGGNSPVLNYHNVDGAQRFALDVLGLNVAGTHATGIYPSDPERYAIFGADILSPCAGEVVEARDGLADLRPPEMDSKNLAGNYVMIRCEGLSPEVDVVLAHMQEGSVAVERGESVEEGQLLGRVGNSGNTSEPHLHIHAVRTGTGGMLKGEGVPILFDDRFLVRNSLILG